MNKNPPNKDLLKIIERALNEHGMSAREASIRAAGTPELIRNMRRGRVPSVERFRSLCRVLGLEFYVGPMHIQSINSRHSLNKKDAMYDIFQEIISRLPPKSTRVKTAEPFKPYAHSKLDNVYHIPVFEINDATSKTLITEGVQVASYVAFQGSWLDEHQLDPKHCIMVRVRDKFMEPTVPKDAVVLVDRSRSRRLAGHIYAVRIDDHLVIGYLEKNKNKWQLIGPSPKCRPRLLPDSTEIIGEVKWMAKTFD